MTNLDSPALQEPPYHEIFTSRLRLRTLRVSDANKLMPLLASREVMRWTTKAPVQDLQQAERWIEDRALGADVFNFVLEIRDRSPHEEEQVIGVAGTFHLPKAGYLIHPDYWGQGFATEAMMALVPAIFARFTAGTSPDSDGDGGESGLDYLEGWIDVENAASRRVLEKCGFTLCEEMDEPGHAPESAGRVAVFRLAREGRRLEKMGLLESGEGEERPVPPLE